MSANKKQRLDKCVAHAYGLTRNIAFSVIKQGYVSVDGEVVLDPSLKIDVDAQLSFDDQDIKVADGFKKRVYMLNKPTACVCADKDAHNRVVMDIFTAEDKADTLHCVGRLDIDTTGLLLVTDDGELNHKITSPKSAIEKTYIAVTDQKIPNSAIEAFARGIHHKEEKKRYKSAKLEILEDNLAKVCVTEGRFHEVKRLFECIGLNVLELKRIQIGSLYLDEYLAEGEYRLLSDDEISKIFQHKE